MKRTLGEIATIVGGRLVRGDAATLAGPDVVISSRDCTPGSVFVALKGEHGDGHTWVGAAGEQGAAVALVAREIDVDCAQIITPDPLEALTALARHLAAEAVDRGVVPLSLTGSSGKTSTKDLLAQVLAADAPTVAPKGNYNNEIGVPLTVCMLTPETRYLVTEMGARGVGHITHLTSIVPPRIAAILNIGTAHIGEFGSQAHIAEAKAEIIAALPADGWAVLNADDPHVVDVAGRTSAQICWFTMTEAPTPAGAAVVRARDISADDHECYSFTLDADIDGQQSSNAVGLHVTGLHQVHNALAAAAMAMLAGVDPTLVADALSQATPRSVWRMEMHRSPSGALIINDAYNANPESMRVAIDTLARLGAKVREADPAARTIAIIGDMAELGDSVEEAHLALGRYAGAAGIDQLIAVGEFAEQLCAGGAGFDIEARVMTKESVATSMVLSATDVVLVKASRSGGLETVADALSGAAGAATKGVDA